MTRRCPAGAARCAGEAERAGHAEVSRQQRAGGADLLVRARVSDAGMRAGARWNVASESEATKKLYGLDDKISEPFGRQCLMARRLVERGVRFVQIFAGGVGNQNTDTWDAHDDIKPNHTQHAAETDRPMAGAADRSQGARPARQRRWSSCIRSSAGCRSRSAASGAITIRARRRC